jgi:hypothetical protein
MSKDLITLETIQQNALAVFTGETDALDILLKQIESEALSLVADVETKKGREVIASNAYKVAQAKSRIEKEGKALADKQKEIPKMIDASRKKAKDFLDALQKTVRLKLDEWEAAETKKEEDRKEAERLKAEREEAERQYQSDHEFALLLNLKFDVEKQQAEIAAAKAKEQAEREAKERAEQAAKEQAEREARIKQQAIADERAKQKAAIERAEREKQQAEQAAKLAIENARLEKERAELREQQAKERAEREKAAAVEREKARAKAEQDRLQAIEYKRKADTAHRTAVKTAVKNALMSECGLTEQKAVDVVKAAIAGKLANLVINF